MHSAVDEAALAERRELGHGLRGSPYFLEGISGRKGDLEMPGGGKKVLRVMGVSASSAPRFVGNGSGLTWADAQLVCSSHPLTPFWPEERQGFWLVGLHMPGLRCVKTSVKCLKYWFLYEIWGKVCGGLCWSTADDGWSITSSRSRNLQNDALHPKQIL
jgi:hypothetical protein